MNAIVNELCEILLGLEKEGKDDSQPAIILRKAIHVGEGIIEKHQDTQSISKHIY